jgi:ribonuclease VapC
MIIDTSALLAILRDEPEALTYARAIESATSRRISAVNFVEAAAVIDGPRDPVASRRFDDLLREAQLAIDRSPKIRRESRARLIGILARAVGTQLS